HTQGVSPWESPKAYVAPLKMLRIHPSMILLPPNVSNVIFLRATVKKMTLEFVLPLGSLTLAKNANIFLRLPKSAGSAFNCVKNNAVKKHTMRFFSKRNHKVRLIAIIKNLRGIANLGSRFLFVWHARKRLDGL
ncbi:MAG: hypothetical protein J5968_07065, partial [Oscillospiraceae bacterium]|nr:hypothetical protein [Oscillospiraceae bacterium]